jgi:ABC-type antimicrobial peptide transport system permease subunit
MQLSSVASLLLGLLFGIIIIMFIVVSILLIYSLLMISVETKAFESAVLRVLGLSKSNCIEMILIQSFIFVLPSIILGYCGSIPALYYIFQYIFKNADGI